MKCINKKMEIAKCFSSCCTCQKCQLDFLGFQGQIYASNNTLFYSAYEYCRWKFVNNQNLHVKKCFGSNQTVACLEISDPASEIQEGAPSESYAKCLNNDLLLQYQGEGLCGEDGLIYDTPYNFCSGMLQNQIQNFEPFTCDFECPLPIDESQKPFCLFKPGKISCSLKECEVYKCMAELRKQQIQFPLCLNNPYNEIVFYKNSKIFCMDKIQNFDTNYKLQQNIDINQDCYLKNNCNAFLCYGLSFLKDYKIGRIGTKRVTALDYQYYLHENRYKDERDHPYFLNEVEFCYDESGLQIDCPSVCDIEIDCEQYCVEYLRQQGYPFDTICIRNKFKEIEFYSNLKDFCIYVAIQEDYHFDKFRDYILCGNNNDEYCLDENQCYLANCVSHPEDVPALIEFLDQSQLQIENKCKEIYGKNIV